jgi:hypothetical protein
MKETSMRWSFSHFDDVFDKKEKYPKIIKR